MKSEGRYLEQAKEINVYGSYDVIVIGGGCAGFPAAIAAARNGAKTLVVERFPFFGGTATASLMANIVGFRNQVEPNYLQTTKGIGEELILKLMEAGGAEKSLNTYESERRSDTKGDLSYNFAFDTELFKYTVLKMVLEAGAEILFHTYFSDVIMEDKTVKGVICETKSGRQAIYGRMVIDASGDGDVALKAGVPFWQIEKDAEYRLNDCLMYKITGFPAGSKATGCLIKNTMVVWGPEPGPTHAADADELTAEEIKMRLAVYQDLEEKKKEFPGELDGAWVLDTGTQIGIRHSRFFEGEYKLNNDDVIEGREFDDAVAMAVNPVVNYYGYRRFLEHEGYQIPYRCLIPKDVDGLYVAGRCMSADRQAYESLRAMAPILAIGEAAGTAAALCAKTGCRVRDLDIKLLQKTLIEQNCEIGQGKKNRK